MNSNINIRSMKPEEKTELLRLARRSFRHSPFELLFISSPTLAIVAEVDGVIAGAVFMRVFGETKEKIGYLDVGFVIKEYRGMGIGGLLYSAATAYLREMGCEIISGLVRDDNAASWKSLQNQGFGTPSLTELVRILGLFPAVVFWLRTALCVAWSARIWLSFPVKKRSFAEEMASYILVNLFLFLPGLFRLVSRPDLLIGTLYAFPFVMIARAFFGGVGCVVAGGSWSFSFPRGGAFLTLFLNTIGATFPMLGRWYPKNPLPTKESRRVMGTQAAIEWAGMLMLFFLGGFILKDYMFFRHSAELSAVLLVYHMIPFPPFGSFGGERVWNFSKLVFAILSGAFIAMMIAAIV